MASILKVNTIQDATNSNTAMNVDSSGRITEPSKPCFAVKSNRLVATTNFDSRTAVPFNEIEFQRGGTIVAITGSGDATAAVFTAPITGIYQFNLVVNLHNAGGGNWNSSYLYIDGATLASNDLTYRSIHDANTYHSLTSSFMIRLNANQTVTPYFQTSGDTSASVRNGCRFSGFLVG